MKPDTDKLSTADLAAASDRPTRSAVADRPSQHEPQQQPRPPSAPPAAAPRSQQTAPDDRVALFQDNDAAELRKRWSDVQTGFVDEPRRSVQLADSLVAHVMSRLAEAFAAEHEKLEKQWDRGDNVTTEDLRVALQRYRSFFDRLLNA